MSPKSHVPVACQPISLAGFGYELFLVNLTKLGKVLFLLCICVFWGCTGNLPPSKPSAEPNGQSLQITTATLPTGTLGNSYTATLSASGGTAPYTWSLTSGKLPSNLELNGASGVISGSPSQAIANLLLTFRVSDSSNPPASQSANLLLSISTAALQVSSTFLPSGQLGTPYQATLTASGGAAPYTWSVASGSLPPGVTLNSAAGALGGTPSTAGNFSFTASVRDAKGQVASSNLSIGVSSAPSPSVSGISPKSGPAVGGTLVTLTGANFRSGALVQFGNSMASSVRLLSPTQIQATTPPEESGTVTLTVQNPDGLSASLANAFTFSAAASSTSPGNPAVNADVVVDASQTVSETGTDDLTAAKNIYAGASAPESDGGIYPDWNLISSQFTMKRMRNINGLGDCALDSNGALAGCSRLNNDLQNIKAHGLTPHVVVGQWAPTWIGPNPLQWSASQWSKYDALAYAIVNYVANQYGGNGFNEALFEVENELDTTTDPRDLWLTPTASVGQGDPSRFAQFDTLYAHWARAVDQVAHQNPNKKIRIAGPATGFWTVRYGNGQVWQNELIKKFAADGTRLDVVSLHQYGGDAADLPNYAQGIRETLNATGNSHAEIWVTEWGPSSVNDSYFGAINANHQGAAWGIYFLLQALKGTVTGGSYLVVRDNQGHDTAGTNSSLYVASWNHVRNSSEYPKPIANAFSMVSRLTGERRAVAVNSSKPDLYALASSSLSSAAVIVANYNYAFDWTHKNFSDHSETENVTVAFKNLPFNGGVTVDRYLIDAQTSNLDYWIAAGKMPPSVQATQLQKVETFFGTVSGGNLTLPVRQYGPSAVSLYIVHP